jgi:hypothetical protein
MRGVVSKHAACCILLVYVWMFFVFPVHAGAQAQDATIACADGQAKAGQDQSRGAWFAIGCLLGGTGLLVALIMEAHPPAVAMLGKSPEYVAAFSDCYRQKAKNIRVGGAMSGCLTAAAIYTALCVIYIVAILAMVDTASESEY